MIPKIIHYCWFSNDPQPSQVIECIKSWQKWLPDYEIKKWTLEDFDVNSVVMTKEALRREKWAFLTDYVRHYALYNYGGIYMDSDVKLYGNIECLLDARFISGCEYHPTVEDKMLHNEEIDIRGNRIGANMKVEGIGVQAAFLAAEPHHPLSKNVMKFYDKMTLDTIMSKRLTAPTVIAYNMERYGYRYCDEEQFLDEGIHLYSTKLISNYNQKSKHSLVVHWCAGSWTERSVIGKIRHSLDTFCVYRSIRDSIKILFYKWKR